jgi:threonylcarbamoyladenosine tRNA methylthiotransferase MtaB
MLCDHFHLSLQSGCDTTLEKMNRKYTTAQYKKSATALRNLLPNAALTTDTIVGFPAETNSDFSQSLAFVQEMAFAQVHVFEFSLREGTPAATLPNQIAPKIKHERGKLMREAAAELQKNFLQKQVGTVAEVLFETEKNGVFQGNTANYCTVHTAANFNLKQSIQKIKISACTENILEGEITDGNPKT